MLEIDYYLLPIQLWGCHVQTDLSREMRSIFHWDGIQYITRL